MRKPQISIVIVNYHSFPEIRGCLESIYQTVRETSFEIIIVNNGSTPKQQASIQQEYPEVKWIDMGYNAGFARGNNAGIKQSQGEYVLILNPDIQLKTNTVDACFQRMERQKALVGAGCQLTSPDGKLQPSGFFFNMGVDRFKNIPYILLLYHLLWKREKPDEHTKYVDWIIGAFMFLRKRTLEQAGCFDEDFFLYSEEIELCSRLSNYGRLTIFWDIEAIHHIGSSSKSKYDIKTSHDFYSAWSKNEKQRILSTQLQFRKQYGVVWFLWYWCNLWTGCLLFFPGKILSNLFKGNPPLYAYHQPLGFFNNLCSLLKHFPYIMFNTSRLYKAV